MTALQRAFSRHENIRRMLANLEELKKNGEIQADEYTPLKAQYEALFEAAFENLKRIASQIKAQRQQAQETLNKLQAEASSISIRGKVGELAPEKVAAELRAIQSQKDICVKSLQRYDGWLAARSSTDVGGYVEVDANETIEYRPESVLDWGKVAGNIGERAKGLVGEKIAGSVTELGAQMYKATKGAGGGHLKKRELKIIGVCVGVLLVVFLGYKMLGKPFSSPYSVDYKVVALNGSCAGVEVTVKGPAAKLAAILTDSKGKSNVGVIEKNEMINNCYTNQLSMDDPQVGTWVLAVKTFDPEEIVWQKEITFSLGQLTIKDVKFGDQLSNIQITLQKDGNLPVRFDDASFTLDGNNFGGTIVKGIIVDQEDTLDIAMGLCPPTKKQIEKYNNERSRGMIAWPPFAASFEPGERYMVQGTLFYGKDRKSLDFEKEFVAPTNSTQGAGEQNAGAQNARPNQDSRRPSSSLDPRRRSNAQ